MGKRSVNEANQRVATTRVLEVSCEPSRLGGAVQELFDKWNATADAAFEASLAAKGGFLRWASSGRPPFTRHYFLLERSDHFWVTFAMTATGVAERGFNPNNRGWLAVITPKDHGSDGTMRILVTLAKWSANDQRLIWNGTRYVQLLDGLVAGLNGRYVSAPVDENDKYFIGNA
jgi:hypothetical protein